MDYNHYGDKNYEVENDIDISKFNDKIPRKFFYRQVLVCSVLWVTYFLIGMCYGGPTVYIPQIRKEANSTEVISDTAVSFLYAIYAYATIPWILILPTAAAYFGRKKPCIFVSVVMFVATITFYTSSSITQIFISEIMESVQAGSLLNINTMVLTEYTSPKYRGIFLTFKAATFCWGIWVSNAIGTYLHWKNIGLVKVILSVYPMVIVFFWPESPYWLASKGELEKCAAAHRWLKGTDKESELELQRLMSNRTKHKDSFIKHIFKKEFYKPVFIGLSAIVMFPLCGKVATGFYSLVIIKKMTSSESTAYTGMLILDGVTILAMYIGTFLSRFLKRRTLFFSSTFVGIVTLYVLSLHNYLVSLSFLAENEYVSIGLLSVYSMGMGCGPMLFSVLSYSELLPLKNRGVAICAISIPQMIVLGSVTQVTPVIIRLMGLHCVFLLFAICSSVFFVILYVFLPETKDKTLLEIADSIMGVKTVNKDELMHLKG